jgi:hypothetical protein
MAFFLVVATSELRIDFVCDRQQHVDEVVRIDVRRAATRPEFALHGTDYEADGICDIGHGCTSCGLAGQRSRWAERRIISRPVASLMAAIRVLVCVEHTEGGIFLIDTTRTVVSFWDTLAR